MASNFKVEDKHKHKHKHYCERPHPGLFLDVLGHTHVNEWNRIIASQNGGSIVIFTLLN